MHQSITVRLFHNGEDIVEIDEIWKTLRGSTGDCLLGVMLAGTETNDPTYDDVLNPDDDVDGHFKEGGTYVDFYDQTKASFNAYLRDFQWTSMKFRTSSPVSEVKVLRSCIKKRLREMYPQYAPKYTSREEFYKKYPSARSLLHGPSCDAEWEKQRAAEHDFLDLTKDDEEEEEDDDKKRPRDNAADDDDECLNAMTKKQLKP